MDMYLYNYAGDERQLSKYLTNIDTVNIISIPDQTNIMAPSVIIASRALNFNYVYIPNFKRYYYVRNIDLLPGERLKVNCSVDVLMSHRSAIQSTQILADRSASDSNPYIVDRAVQSSDKATTYVRNMGVTPFTPGTGTYILTIAGRGGN